MRSLAAAVVLSSVTAGAAHAGGFDFVGTRPLGTGGAMRGAATGDAGPMLNPSGMSLTRAYVVEAAYQYVRRPSENDARFSVVDSTSGFNVAGGVYYTYRNARPANGKERGHEGGLSLALPLGDRFFIGGTLKYLRLEAESATGEMATTRGLTGDVGITVKPVANLSVGAAGYNLFDLETGRAPVGVGGGIAVSLAKVLLVGDAVVDFTSGGADKDRILHFMGGAEVTLAKIAALRGGGGRDGRSGNGYASAGLSAIAEFGALDVAVRQDVSGRQKETFIGASGRLFVPAP